VQFEHGGAGRDQIGTVNLDFVIAIALRKQEPAWGGGKHRK
jgi:hypothetical protein